MCMLPTKTHFRTKNRLKMKIWKECSIQMERKKAMVAVLRLDKVDIKTKSIFYNKR